MILSDLPSPAEASSRKDGLSKGFAQAGNRCPLFRIMRASLFFRELRSGKNLFAGHQHPGIPANFLDGRGRFPYLQRRDTSPQREAYYLEG